MTDKSKIKRAETEISIYEGALSTLKLDGVKKVSTDYMDAFIKDLKRVLELDDD